MHWQIRICADGPSYWETFADQLPDVHFSRKQQEEKQKAASKLDQCKVAYKEYSMKLQEWVIYSTSRQQTMATVCQPSELCIVKCCTQLEGQVCAAYNGIRMGLGGDGHF